MSRQAVSLHIKILEECGLIMLRQQGRERYCEATLDGLSEVSAWVEQYKQHFEQKLRVAGKIFKQTSKATQTWKQKIAQPIASSESPK